MFVAGNQKTSYERFEVPSGKTEVVGVMQIALIGENASLCTANANSGVMID